MDEETKCKCTPDCTCKCDDANCGCCEKVMGDADLDSENEEADAEEAL